MKKELLFQWCSCTAFLKKVWDGVGIEIIKPEHTMDGEETFLLHYGNHEVPEGAPESSPCEGDYDLEKTYYERRDKNFKGICVGFKTVKTEGYLGVDTYCDPYYGERHRIFKETKTTVDCALVYFANNQSRLVPLDAIQLLEVGAHR